MLVELDIIDHIALDEDKRCMIMLIFDVEDLWHIEAPHGLEKLTYNKKCREKNTEHLLYLKKKVENYIGYIQNDGIRRSFPDCDNPESFSYEIRVVTNFAPTLDYLDLIEQMNHVLTRQGLNIVVTNEKTSEKNEGAG